MAYDLDLDNATDEYTCSTSYSDDNGATQNWNDDTSCDQSGNYVMLNSVAVAAITTTDHFTWEINGVKNPQMGMDRTAATNWDWDATDADLGMTADKWIGKFGLMTYDLSDTKVTGCAYGNLNAAYLGFSY